MGILHGTVTDATDGSALDVKVHVLTSTGQFAHPPAALLKRGPGIPFFFARGEFEVEAPRGRTDVLVERGTEYEPERVTVDMPEKGSAAVHVALRRWYVPQADGWFPGNTHLHYDEREQQPDERLAVDCSAEGYNVTCVSILERRGLPYASNKYPIGVLNDFTTAHHVLDIGEENRHYGERTPWGFGYGHVMLLRLRNLVQPVSRGHTLAGPCAPDYPPLCFACDAARDQGGVVIWCHNGKGMEAPVAAALGKLDAFNLFDPFWADPEYELWYRLLDCGWRLPASTGTDWFVCSNNRVYVQTRESFSYGAWIDGLRAGRTFITNGPALGLQVDGAEPGAVLDRPAGGQVEAQLQFTASRPVERLELVVDGHVARGWTYAPGRRTAVERHAVRMERDGWIAARAWADTRDSFGHAGFAHTSPVYLRCGAVSAKRDEAARYFVDRIDASLSWIDTWGRFDSDRQRRRVRELFRAGRQVYAGLTHG